MTDHLEPTGEFVTAEHGGAYRIAGHDRMPPFTMTVVSSSDHWMYLSSSGGLTAGRVEAANCLFPYETDDRLHVSPGVSGPLTIVRVGTPDGLVVWRPFDPRRSGGRYERSLTRAVIGNWVEFVEVDHDLGLRITQRWTTADRFGFVRSVTLQREPTSAAGPIEVLDGFLDVMPAGVLLETQQTVSTLVDAYKRSEYDPETRVGLFTLEAQISDHPEPAESLRANVVWSRGLGDHRVLMSDAQVPRFLRSGEVDDEWLALGRRGCYLVAFHGELGAGERWSWDLVADVGLDHRAVTSLRAFLAADPDPIAALRADIEAGTDELIADIATADGFHLTADRMMDAHHAANVLFNIMRGGVFVHNDDVDVDDLLGFIAIRNRPVADAHRHEIASLGPTTDIRTVRRWTESTGDADLIRLGMEYLPIHFSRRHGDPSRPWNKFTIRTRNPDGSHRIAYEGNWRDIFQNWEALARSFPGFLDGMIAKFVNASTLDGHNPYRITSEGIDWEIPDPDDPWGNIGYWGDHQIVYLLRLIEAAERHAPDALVELLDRDLFSYADVPYRLAPFADIVGHPKSTITFDESAEREIERRVDEMGTDGKLVVGASGSVHHVNLTEKLLVTALAKIANLVVDGGIWMNTQRPEWNDANNALVGSGLSMVTLCHLRRYAAWLADTFDEQDRTFPVSVEVATWVEDSLAALGRAPDGEFDDVDRRALLDALGEAGSRYRSTVYQHGLGERTELASATIVELCRALLGHLDRSIRANRRDDGLYHSYNLLELGDDTARVDHLDEMLEGQVAVISAGVLTGAEVAALVDALFDSALYRPDLHTFLLYPARTLPSFLEKNRIPADDVASNPLLAALVQAGDDSIVTVDAAGDRHFHPECDTTPHLVEALDRLGARPEWSDLVAAHREQTLAAYEAVFRHGSFTGRSSTMYKYEGLGSVYWHMVGKLLLAVQEAFTDAAARGEPPEVVEALAAAYHRIRGGLCFVKSPAEYGAFPFDPYSHSPAHLGAQQPGMTGQVKESIIARHGELGIHVEHGRVRFQPALLRPHEFLDTATEWRYLDVDGRPETLTLEPRSLAFTLWGVPIVYRLTDGGASVTIIGATGERAQSPGTELDAETSSRLFARDGSIRRVEVDVAASALCSVPG